MKLASSFCKIFNFGHHQYYYKTTCSDNLLASCTVIIRQVTELWWESCGLKIMVLPRVTFLICSGNNIVVCTVFHTRCYQCCQRPTSYHKWNQLPWQQPKLVVKTRSANFCCTVLVNWWLCCVGKHLTLYHERPGCHWYETNFKKVNLPSFIKVMQIKLTYHDLYFCLSPRFELPVKDEGGEKKSMNIVCHCCNQPGHKASGCPSNPHKENFKVSST